MTEVESSGETDVTESGRVFFLLRPRVEEEEPEGVEDVQNLYMVLRPSEGRVSRQLIVGRKMLPDPEASGRHRFWSFVEAVDREPEELTEPRQEVYETETRGRRRQPEDRPLGEGRYAIARHGDHTHFVYELELPRGGGEVQEELNLERDASYVLAVKNPEQPSPPGAGLPEGSQPEYPQRLQERFAGRRFAPADPPELLDHEGAQVVLISASNDAAEELGLELAAERKLLGEADLFAALGIDPERTPRKPLTRGEWE